MKQVGLVAIGRNQGSRLRQCLMEAIRQVAWVVYVDSGSTDGSLELARSIKAIQLNSTYLYRLPQHVPEMKALPACCN